MKTIREIEEKMADLMLRPHYANIVEEYNRLLTIMGNVDGDESVALTLVAAESILSKSNWGRTN